MEVWFQRASDVMRKLRTGDVDLGIVGYDMFIEYGQNDPNLIVVHDALGFGKCYLSLGVPKNGPLKDVNSIQELASLGMFTESRPMRVVTGYHHIAREFFKVGRRREGGEGGRRACSQLPAHLTCKHACSRVVLTCSMHPRLVRRGAK